MYYFLKIFADLISFLSLNGTKRLAKIFTFIGFDLLRKRRKIIMKNLNIAFGSEQSKYELVKLGRLSVYNFFLTVFEFLRSQKYDINANVDIKGLENIEHILKDNKGIYFVGCHVGNWEVMASKISRSISPLYAIVKKVGSEGVDKFVRERRLLNGLFPIERKSPGDAYRKIIKVINNGDVILFMVDQFRYNEPKINYFGVPTSTNTSLASIWPKHPAPVVPVYAKRIDCFKYEINILPEIKMRISEDKKSDILHNTLTLNQTMESIIKTIPEQYLWLHNRWKDYP